VASGTIPVSRNWFGVKTDNDSEILGNSVKNVSGDPKFISHVNSFRWSNLVFPLGRHNLSIGSADSNSSVETSSVVSFDDISSEDFVSSNSTIVRSLWAWESALWPAERMEISVQKRILLFHSKPWVLVLCLGHSIQARLSVVGFSWFLVVLVGVTKDELVVPLEERILVDCHGVQVDVRV